MAQRNTYREDEALEEQINLKDILRIGAYLKPYKADVFRILTVVIFMSCIAVSIPYMTKIMIDQIIPAGDMTGLLRWMFEQSAVNVVKQYKLPQEYKKALSFVMDYIEKNSFILNSIYDSVGLEEMKLFLYPDIQKIIRTCIDSKEKELHLHVKEEFKSFICNLYTEGFTGTLLRQIKSPEKLSREEAISYYSLILNVSLPAILKSAPGQKHTQPET